MTITLNGEPCPLDAAKTVSALVAAQIGRELLPSGQPADGGRLGVAVVRNAEVVPRSQWGGTGLEPGDEVEIVTAVQGG